MADARPGRSCIIIAPFFPPSGLPPAHRARLFVRYLASFGWTPIVITVDPRDREEPPEAALERTVPAGVRIERVRALPVRLTRRLGVGDLGLRALPTLAWRAIRVTREVRGGAVLLIVPPWYGLWLAPLIQWAGGAPVVVDYVDPWRIQPTRRLKSRLAAWIAAHTEAFGLRGVSGVFAVAEKIITDIQERYVVLRSAPTAAAPYGFEPTDLALVSDRSRGAPPVKDVGQIRIVYVGAISDAQLPVLAALLDALACLRTHGPVNGKCFRLELYGTTYGTGARATPRAAALVEERRLGDIVVESPLRVPYADALALMANADVNLVLGDTTRYYAASKLMPVLAARRPLLGLLHADTEPAELLQRLGARGLVCYGTDEAASPSAVVSVIAGTLREFCYERIPVVTCDFAGDITLARRTASHMTGQLAGLLNRVADRYEEVG